MNNALREDRGQGRAGPRGVGETGRENAREGYLSAAIPAREA